MRVPSGAFVARRNGHVFVTGNSGFPKSLNLGNGIGTALKPAHEPIVLAQKPLQGTYAANVARWGVGGLNIGACRIGYGDKTIEEVHAEAGSPTKGTNARAVYGGFNGEDRAVAFHPAGRWPANVMLDEEAAAALDEQSGERKAGGKVNGSEPSHTGQHGIYGTWGRVANTPHNDSGGASRFFYCAKASRSERDAGLDSLPHLHGAALTDRQEGSAGLASPRSGAGRTSGGRNIHPTVKPIALMRWLVRLVTPPGEIALDPFMGSGTTGVACVREGRSFIGIEQHADYYEIARQRIGAAQPGLPLDAA